MILIAASCAEETSQTAAATVRDSTGIRIIENPPSDSASLTWWAVEELPALEIGEAEGAEAEMLFRVRDAARLSDGRIAIATHTDVRYFDADGNYLYTTGREGAGPGEFESLIMLLPAGNDTLWAYDYQLRRVSASTIRRATGSPARGCPRASASSRSAPTTCSAIGATNSV